MKLKSIPIVLLVALLSLTFAPVFTLAQAPAPAGATSGVTGSSQAPAPAGATSGVTGGGSSGSTFALKNPLKGINSVGGLLNKFIEILSYLLIIFAVLMIVYTGLKLILARGNPDELKEQGKRLGYILIGVALVIGARVIITVIINTLEATGTVDPAVIQSSRNGVQGR
jgi:uncharacterized membrane protein